MAETSQAITSIRQSFIHCPITALGFYPSQQDQRQSLYILAAEDAWLKVYSTTSPTHLIAQVRIFSAQAIHGLSVSAGGAVLIWGSSSVSLLSRSSLEALISGDEVPSPTECKTVDWIYDGSLCPADETKGVLVTAHNEVVPFRVGDDGEGLVFEELVSPSRPILYSACVEWVDGGETVLVAAGTVFGEIVVWKAHLTQEKDKAEVMFVFTGHEGSIFGVAISSLMDVGFQTGKSRFLASCSDDRTVRIWDITEREAKTERQKRIDEGARETGFGGSENSESVTAAEQEESKRRCLAAGMGHASRIWHVKFQAPPGDQYIDIWSFGEDATVQKWELGQDENEFTWHFNKREATACHSGKHIWSCAVTSGPSGSLIATGGGDGKVTLLGGLEPIKTMAVGFNCTIDGDRLPNMPFSRGREVSGQEELEQSPKAKSEAFLRYAFLSESSLLISTTSGRLLLTSLEGRLKQVEVELSEEVREDLKSYNVVKTIAPGMAMIGSKSGRLNLLQQTSFEYPQTYKFTELTRDHGKISDILLLPDFTMSDGATDEASDGALLGVMIQIQGQSEVTMIIINPDEPTEPIVLPSVPVHAGFITTAAAFCNGIIILGSRRGILTTYREVNPNDDWVQQTHRHDSKIKDAITSITILPASPDSPDPKKYILTTSRDGKIRIYELTQDGNLHLRHETTPPLGPMLEGARFFFPSGPASDPELILYGFKSTTFVVWNETRQTQLASIPCGGAHRTFDYLSSSPTNPALLRFVYTKASAMSIYSQDSTSLTVAKPGGHGREIKAVASESQHGYIATGAEDTCIRIWERPSDSNIKNMKCLAVLQKHTAGIQALKWFGGEHLLSSAGGEEFFIWRVTRIDSAYKGLAVVFEAAYPDQTKDKDLRITDFDVTADKENKGRMVITLAFSNSTIKTYRYATENGFELLCEGRYTGACLTQVQQLRKSVVLTAATDGVLAVWRRNGSEYKLEMTSRVHQSSVKALDLRSSEDRTSWTVMTGGDDNGLGITCLEWHAEEDKVMVSSKGRVRDAHAAAITGAGIVREDGDDTYLATVSNDQRLKIWRITAAPGQQDVHVALVSNEYSGLADPGGVDMIAPGKLMVAGVGMEIWDCPK